MTRKTMMLSTAVLVAMALAMTASHFPRSQYV